MRIGLAIDAACDLPQAFLEQHDIAVMPITVKVDGESFLDDRGPTELQRFIDRQLGSRSHSALTEPCPVDEVQKLFLDKLVLEQDCVFCLTITATRSPIQSECQLVSALTSSAFLMDSCWKATRGRTVRHRHRRTAQK